MLRMTTVARRVLRRTTPFAGVSMTSSLAPRPSSLVPLRPECCRFTSTTTTAAGPVPGAADSENVVDVENFTLNMEIVQKHLDAGEAWTAFGKQLADLKVAAAQATPSAPPLDGSALANDAAVDFAEVQQKWGAVASFVKETGLPLLTKIGPDNSPILCEPMLLLELAQAQLNSDQFSGARESAASALAIIEAVPVKSRDDARVAEIKDFLAQVAFREGNYDAALTLLNALLGWIDVDSRKAMPFVQVAARNMRRHVITHKGEALAAKALAIRSGKLSVAADPRQLAGEALDLFVEALPQHVDETDVRAVITTMEGAAHMFVVIGDNKQAKETAEKLIAWCTKHEQKVDLARASALSEKLSGLTA